MFGRLVVIKNRVVFSAGLILYLVKEFHIRCISRDPCEGADPSFNLSLQM